MLRKAGQRLRISPDTLEEILTPWEGYERDRNLPNYYGRTQSEWQADNKNIRDNLLIDKAEGASESDLRYYLHNMGFTNELEQTNILRNLNNRSYRGKLHTEKMWVPGAAADEELSKAVLEYSGFSPVRLENANGDPMATDLRVTIDGAPRFVDAQMRARQFALPLELTKFNNRAFDVIKENPNLTLNELVKKIKDRYPGISESKFLQTSDPEFNAIMSNKVATNPNYEKDYIISSNRVDQNSGPQGPYNKVRPNDWDLIDLRKAREILLPLTRSQMLDKYGVTLVPGNRSGNPIIEVPTKFIKNELNDRNNPLDEYAVSRLTQ